QGEGTVCLFGIEQGGHAGRVGGANRPHARACAGDDRHAGGRPLGPPRADRLGVGGGFEGGYTGVCSRLRTARLAAAARPAGGALAAPASHLPVRPLATLVLLAAWRGHAGRARRLPGGGAVAALTRDRLRLPAANLVRAGRAVPLNPPQQGTAAYEVLPPSST